GRAASSACDRTAERVRCVSRKEDAMLGAWKKKVAMPPREQALPGRPQPMPIVDRHAVSGHAIAPPYPDGLELALFGLGCFRHAGASSCADHRVLEREGYGHTTTEILGAPEFYFAEDYHQQYLAKNPFGYCGLGGTGLACPVGLGATTGAAETG